MAQKRFLDVLDGIKIYEKSKKYTDSKDPYYAKDGHVKSMFHSYMDGHTLVLGAGCATIVEENGKRILDIHAQVDGSTIVIS